MGVLTAHQVHDILDMQDGHGSNFEQDSITARVNRMEETHLNDALKALQHTDVGCASSHVHHQYSFCIVLGSP